MSQYQSIVFFVDRCLGSKRVVETLRNSGLSIEVHDEHFHKGAQDVDWLPEVGKRGWVVLTKDAKIGKHTSEKFAVFSAKVKMIVLASQSMTGDQMIEAFLKAIVPMQEFVRKHPAPFIAKLFRDGHIDMWKDGESLEEELKQFY
ncbi:hypothetical protein WA1_19005 [Scytonema hofmannii PCC 7110]|uniref:VapC45 PIN like domain-containing protein n=1 Tax=Scytonema hofmannii PCC 7110 TaxID=128403 RepID=A0A139XBL1_9CYAN|nr:hypothetical protein [Scytonema hofmannii]KYC42090.1 hypothetical protein WA1_19005 [Scytonema hofmannii PCC 7110]